MAGGWTRDGAVQDQIDASVDDAVLAARARMPAGASVDDSAEDCALCGEPIPERRRQALPGVRTCVGCQSMRDRTVVHSGINRRGSKDSQLR